MGKIVTMHSSRGGTGKSLISVNVGAVLASRGKNVCLLDLDFRAPSLHVVFKMSPEYWLNDFLNRETEIENVVQDLTSKYGTRGKFMVGFADPSVLAIRDMSMKDRKWEMKALQRLLSLKDLSASGGKIDYFIFDTSPGIQYASVNAVVSSDVVTVVTTMDALDIQGTRSMIKELYDAFGKKTGILLNKVMLPVGPPTFLPLTDPEKDALLKQLKETFDIPIFGMIPCYCDVLRTSRTFIFAFQNADHPFTKDVVKVADVLERM